MRQSGTRRLAEPNFRRTRSGQIHDLIIARTIGSTGELMKRIGTLVTALLVAFAFTATTFASYTAEAKTYKSDTNRKKKKKKKSKSASHRTPNKATKTAKADSSSGTKADRAPASAGYQRASLYMSKHDDTGKHKKKKKKKHTSEY